MRYSPLIDYTEVGMADPLLLTIPQALTLTGIGRSYLYERLAEGSIKSVKAGRRRLIDASSLQQWANSLPTAPLKQTEKGR
jgi:excisionase family DNA binding protein